MAFNRDIAEQALEVIRETGSLRQACLRLGFDRRSFTRLCEQDPEFEAAYARAKAEGIDALVEETLDIADDGSNDWMRSNKPDAEGYVLNGEHVQRSKVRIETRRWLAERMAPRKYGVLQKMELTGADGGPIQQQQVVIATGVPAADDHSDLA